MPHRTAVDLTCVVCPRCRLRLGGWCSPNTGILVQPSVGRCGSMLCILASGVAGVRGSRCSSPSGVFLGVWCGGRPRSGLLHQTASYHIEPRKIKHVWCARVGGLGSADAERPTPESLDSPASEGSALCLKVRLYAACSGTWGCHSGLASVLNDSCAQVSRTPW